MGFFTEDLTSSRESPLLQHLEVVVTLVAGNFIEDIVC